MKRVTTRKPPGCEPGAADCTIFRDRVHRINGTRRLEPAHGREQRRDESFVQAKEKEEKSTHGSALSRHAFEHTDEIGRKLGELGSSGGVLHVHDEIERLLPDAELGTMSPVRFPNPPLEPIPDVRFPDLPRRGHADSRVAELVRPREYDDVATKVFLTLFVGTDEISSFRDALGLGEIPARNGGRPHVSSPSAGPLRITTAASDRETLPSLAATTRQNGLPVLGSHADEEPVRALATTVVRLISTFHVRFLT